VVKTIDAMFDGNVFRPSEPVALTPNTHVRITFETSALSIEPATSFLDTASSLKLEGPADWSVNLRRLI
jgi:hypothetical protein